MNTSESFQALRRANPRATAGFAESVEAAADAVRARIVTTAAMRRWPRPCRGTGRPIRGVARARLAVGAALAVAAAVAAAFLTVGSPGGGPGVENAAAAVKKAATVTAASAERSGTARRPDHPRRRALGRHHDPLARRGPGRRRDAPARRGEGRIESSCVVDGTLYGVDPADGGWVMLGSPDSIDPDSGTTPDEYLAAVREDVGGATLRRITDGMTGLTTRQLDDGSTVYSGTVAAGLIARESGFKEGQPIRVLPFGYVAHDEAADPAAPLDAAVTVGADGIVREIAVTWGTAPRRGRTRSPTAASARPRPRSRPRTRDRCGTVCAAHGRAAASRACRAAPPRTDRAVCSGD